MKEDKKSLLCEENKQQEIVVGFESSQSSVKDLLKSDNFVVCRYSKLMNIVIKKRLIISMIGIRMSCNGKEKKEKCSKR